MTGMRRTYLIKSILAAIVTVASIMLWWLIIAHQLDQTGLFRWIGIDYGRYWAQAQLFWNGQQDAIYDTAALLVQSNTLLPYTADPAESLAPGPVAYPPIFAWMLWPFIQFPPHIGFLLWTMLNFGAACYLGWRCASFFRPEHRLPVMLLVIVSFPVMFSLFVGQPMIFLAIAVGEAFLSFRSGQNFRAGLWISCLVLKPQYAVLIGLVLLWKRQWNAVIGAFLGVSLTLLISIIVAGPSVLLSYPSALVDMSNPDIEGAVFQMINWRTVAHLATDILNLNDAWCPWLALIPSLATVIVAFLVWRGPWPVMTAFPQRYTLLLMATIISGYHSHAYGLVLLTVPAAYLLANRHEYRLSLVQQVLMLLILILPTLAFAVGLGRTAVFPALSILPLIVLLYALSVRHSLAIPLSGGQVCPGQSSEPYLASAP